MSLSINAISKKEFSINVCGEEIILSSLRAVYWPQGKTLVAADLHLGKTAHFRKNGIPVSGALQNDDINRLTQLITIYQPEKLVIAGDMFHHQSHNTDIDAFAKWRSENLFPEIILVKGNHDRLSSSMYASLKIDVVDHLHLSPFSFLHECADENHFTFCGHLHPGVVVSGPARQSLRLACFVIDKGKMVLPAFSKFSGLCTKYDFGDDAKIFAIAGEQVLEV